MICTLTAQAALPGNPGRATWALNGNTESDPHQKMITIGYSENDPHMNSC